MGFMSKSPIGVEASLETRQPIVKVSTTVLEVVANVVQAFFKQLAKMGMSMAMSVRFHAVQTMGFIGESCIGVEAVSTTVARGSRSENKEKTAPSFHLNLMSILSVLTVVLTKQPLAHAELSYVLKVQHRV